MAAAAARTAALCAIAGIGAASPAEQAWVLGADIAPRLHMDFFAHPHGLVVLDRRLCLPQGEGPGKGEAAEITATVQLFAGEGGARFWLQLYRPFRRARAGGGAGGQGGDEAGGTASPEPEPAGYTLQAQLEVPLEEGGGLIKQELPWSWQPGDCLGWHSVVHGVVTFEDEAGPAEVLLLLPGATLAPGERIERRHLAGPVARRYSARLLANSTGPATATGPAAAAACLAALSEQHWALSSSSGSPVLPASDGEWSAGNSRLCRTRGHRFFSGRFGFLGAQQSLLFGLCAPQACSEEDVRGAAGTALLERLAPGAAAATLRKVEARVRGKPLEWNRACLLLAPLVLGPCIAGGLWGIAGGALLPSAATLLPLALQRLWQGQPGHTVEAQCVRLACALLGVLHLLLGLDIFCEPGPPTWLWSDMDALFGYLPTQVLFLLSAQLFLGPSPPGPRAAVARLLRKWLRLAPVGLLLRLVACSPAAAQLSRPWRSAAVPRLASGEPASLDVSCHAPRCTSDVRCAQPFEGWPFGAVDVLMAFPEVADVGWFIEADLVHSTLLAALCVLRGLPGGRVLTWLLSGAWAADTVWQLLLVQPCARHLFDCTRPSMVGGVPYLCLNFAVGPLAAWFAALLAPRCVLPATSLGAFFAALAAAALPWLLDCAVMQALGLPEGCYTFRRAVALPGDGGMNSNAAAEGLARSVARPPLAWHLARVASLILLHIAVLALLQRQHHAGPGLLAIADRLSFGVIVVSPSLLRVVFFSWHSACLEFTAFALFANLLGATGLAGCVALAMHAFVQHPWEALVARLCPRPADVYAAWADDPTPPAPRSPLAVQRSPACSSNTTSAWPHMPSRGAAPWDGARGPHSRPVLQSLALACPTPGCVRPRDHRGACIGQQLEEIRHCASEFRQRASEPEWTQND